MATMIDIEVERELSKLASEVGTLPKAVVHIVINGSTWITGDKIAVPPFTGIPNEALAQNIASRLRLCQTHVISSGFSAQKSDFFDAVNKLPSNIVT